MTIMTRLLTPNHQQRRDHCARRIHRFGRGHDAGSISGPGGDRKIFRPVFRSSPIPASVSVPVAMRFICGTPPPLPSRTQSPASPFSPPQKAFPFGYDPVSNTFGGLSVAGQNGAFAAAVNGDLGSPGTFINLPRITQPGFINGSGFNLSFVTQPNLGYSVEYKNNLADPAWLTLTNFTAFQIWPPLPTRCGTNATRFYRIVMTLDLARQDRRFMRERHGLNLAGLKLFFPTVPALCNRAASAQ